MRMTVYMLGTGLVHAAMVAANVVLATVGALVCVVCALISCGLGVMAICCAVGWLVTHQGHDAGNAIGFAVEAMIPLAGMAAVTALRAAVAGALASQRKGREVMRGAGRLWLAQAGDARFNG